MPHLFKRYRDNEDGTTAVEFGVLALGFLAMIFAVIEMGRIFMVWNSV